MGILQCYPFDMVIPSSAAQFNKQRKNGYCSSFIIQKFGHSDDNSGESIDKHFISVPSAI